jgi:cytochrome c553
MIKKISALILLALSSHALAKGNSEAGQSKAAMCAACHGPTGVSSNPLWPTIAGQHARYLVKQLQDFKDNKTRTAPTMNAIVASLTTQDMDDLAAFYAQQPRPEGRTAQKYLKRGQSLYRGGDFTQHITACIACHGPKGTGNAEAGFPLLSGQQAEYTVTQLQAFKDKQRRNDLNGIMQDISARMSKEDMEAVAHYLTGLY